MLPSKQKYYQYLLEKELAYPSLMILQDKVSDYFHRIHGTYTSAFPNHACDLIWPGQEIIDVVLFGDALQTIVWAKNWPRKPKYRLWVLCHDMKRIINDLVGIPLSSIGVIPRYEIFPMPQSPYPLPSTKENFHFVMSSSYALSKNIELTIGVVNEIQKRSQGEVKLTICSPKPEEYLARNAIKKLKWKFTPEIKGDLGLNWQETLPKDSVMINFSTNLFEDFGVSAAQAQEVGFPLIVSDWGAHKDLAGENILKVPPSVFGHHITKENMQSRITRTVDFIEKALNEPPSTFPKLCEHLKPKALNIEQILNYTSKFESQDMEKVRDLFRASIYDPQNHIAQNILKHFSP